jgi:hypothetical protein
MSLRFFTIIFSLFLLIYHQVTTVVPLFPWNDVQKYSWKELLAEAGTNGLLMGCGAWCLIAGNSGFYHYYPLIYYPFLMCGEIIQWWIPYFSDNFSKSKVNFDYDRLFGRTMKLIPHKPGKRTPDANHIVLHFITVVTVVQVYFERLG